MTDLNNSTPPPAAEAPKADAVNAPSPVVPTAQDKIYDELKKYKAMAQDYEAKIKQKEVDDLTKNQQWQQLAELKEVEAKEARESMDKLKAAFITKEKMSSIREAAIQAGLRKESIPDLRLIDFPELKLETNSEGEFIASGADKAIQRLKTLRPHWFQNAAPNVNSSSPIVTGDGNSLTFGDVKKLQDEYSKNPNPANAEKLKGALLQFKKQASAK